MHLAPEWCWTALHHHHHQQHTKWKNCVYPSSQVHRLDIGENHCQADERRFSAKMFWLVLLFPGICHQSVCIQVDVCGCVWTESWELRESHMNYSTNCHLQEHCYAAIHQNVQSYRQTGQLTKGSAVWVCNAIKWLLRLVWSASFHLVLLIWKKDQIRWCHHVFSHQKWWMTMFPLCFLFISSLRLQRAVVIRSSPALHTMSYCGEKQSYIGLVKAI